MADDSGSEAASSFNADDHRFGTVGERMTRFGPAVGLLGVGLYFNSRLDQFQKRPRDLAWGEWWSELLVEAVIVEVLLTIAIVIVPLSLAARRSRLVGVTGQGAASANRRNLVRLALLQVAMGTIEGVAAFSVLRLQWWPIALPVLLLSAWWAQSSRQFILLRRLWPMRRAEPSDHWPRLVDELATSPTQCWVRPTAHFSTAMQASVTCSRPAQHLIATDSLDSLPMDEQRAVIAHEVGHLHLRHVTRLLRSVWLQRSAAGMIGGLAVVLVGRFDGRDPSGYALFRFVAVFGLSVSALALAKWRQQLERDADAYALDATRDPDAFQRMVVSISRANRANVASLGGMASCGVISPTERLAAADQWRAKHSPLADDGSRTTNCP